MTWIQIRMSKREFRAQEKAQKKQVQEGKRLAAAKLESSAINPYYTRESRQALLQEQRRDSVPQPAAQSSLVVGIYSSPSRRGKSIVANMYEGIKVCSDDVPVMRDQKMYRGPENFHAIVFYGLRDNLATMLQDYRRRGVTTMFWDMGYWGRGKGEMLSGYHRVAINDLQPNNYFWSFKAPPDRFNRFRLRITPWRTDGMEILMAGLSEKNARVLHKLGLLHTPDPTKYAIWLRDEIRKYTDRPIAYRPKPSWKEARPIEGMRYAVKPGKDGLLWELRDCWAVVTFRSNVAIDGIIAGVPCFVVGDGVAKCMGHTDLSMIESPLYPENREQFCFNLAYCQWHFSEMKDGEVWRYHKSKGLIP